MRLFEIILLSLLSVGLVLAGLAIEEIFTYFSMVMQ